jgi:tetratricopeptide (TPR) repeat protein
VGDPAKAREYSRSALTASEEAAALDTGTADTSRELLSSSYYHLGKASLRTDDVDLARRSLGECLRLRREIVAADPFSAYAKEELGRAHDVLGDLEVELRRGRESLPHYREAHRIFEDLHAKDRGSLELRWYLGNADYHLGTVHRLLGDKEWAEAYVRACLETRELLLKNDPKNMQRQIELMLVRARLGRHREAAQAARVVCDYAPGHPGKLFGAACGYALCVHAVARSGASTPDEEALRRDYTAKAIEAIDRAIAHGFRDRLALQCVPELESLRGGEEFQGLLLRLMNYPQRVGEKPTMDLVFPSDPFATPR